MSAPKWLDAAFAQKALRNGGERNARVQSILARPASADGENYICELFRVTAVLADDADADAGSRSLIVKSPMENGLLPEYCRQAKYYADEAYMYSKGMPAVEALLEEAAPGRFPQIAPRCYHIEGETLVLEDIAPYGFQLVEKSAGLDVQHSVLALKTLARLHGASIQILREKPELLNGLTCPLKAPSTADFEAFVLNNLAVIVGEIRSWTDFPHAQRLATRLEAAAPDAIFRATSELESRPNWVNVLVHGDLWATNILFRYSAGVPEEARFVDLQLCHLNSLAVDLIMFRFLSLSLDAWHQWGRLLEEYHRELKVTLKLLGGPPAPTVQQIEAEIKRHRAWPLIVVGNWLPVARAAPGQKIDLEASFEGKTGRRANFSDVFKKWLKIILLHFEQTGTFEN